MSATSNIRAKLRKQLAAISAELQTNDEIQARIAKAADEHHTNSHQASERARARLGLHDGDTPEATEYDDALHERHKAALVSGHLKGGR